MKGFIGPADIFRNPQAIFRQFEPSKKDNDCPFDIILSTSGNDWAVMTMILQLGLYEHQSAKIIQAIINLLQYHGQQLLSNNNADHIKKIKIIA